MAFVNQLSSDCHPAIKNLVLVSWAGTKGKILLISSSLARFNEPLLNRGNFTGDRRAGVGWKKGEKSKIWGMRKVCKHVSKKCIYQTRAERQESGVPLKIKQLSLLL